MPKNPPLPSLFMCVHTWIFSTRMNDGLPLLRAADANVPCPQKPGSASAPASDAPSGPRHVRAPLNLPSFREGLSALSSSEGLSRLSWTQRSGNSRERLSTGRFPLSLVYRPSQDRHRVLSRPVPYRKKKSSMVVKP